MKIDATLVPDPNRASKERFKHRDVVHELVRVHYNRSDYIHILSDSDSPVSQEERRFRRPRNAMIKRGHWVSVTVRKGNGLSGHNRETLGFIARIPRGDSVMAHVLSRPSTRRTHPNVGQWVPAKGEEGDYNVKTDFIFRGRPTKVCSHRLEWTIDVLCPVKKGSTATGIILHVHNLPPYIVTCPTNVSLPVQIFNLPFPEVPRNRMSREARSNANPYQATCWDKEERWVGSAWAASEAGKKEAGTKDTSVRLSTGDRATAAPETPKRAGNHTSWLKLSQVCCKLSSFRGSTRATGRGKD